MMLMGGCAGVGEATTKPVTGSTAVPPARPRVEWLADGATAIWAGHLGEAQRALLEIADREVRRPDPALDFWAELVALLRCEPLRGAPRQSRALTNEWDRLRRLVQIERLRLAATLPAHPPAAPINGGANPAKLLGGSPVRPPLPSTRVLVVQAAPAGAMTWPVESESWGDEAPAARVVVDHCPQAPVLPGAAMNLGGPGETMMVRELTTTLAPDHPALPALLFEEAVLAIASGDPAAALGPLYRLPAGAGAEGPNSPFSAGERAQLALTWAIAADVDAMADPEHREVAVMRLRVALAADLPHDIRRVLSYRLSEQLRVLGRIEDAVIAIGPPPHGNDAMGNYLAFRQVEAHVKAGRRAEALAEARAALNRQQRAVIDADAALAAIDDLALRILVSAPLTAQSIEVIEALGDPSERIGRVDRFAQMAEAVGAHGSAMDAFLWLMQNDPDDNRRLHHLARASVAAARAGDRAQFSRTFAQLAGQSQEDADADTQTARATKPTKDKVNDKDKDKDWDKDKPTRPGGIIDSPDADRLYRHRQRERSLSWQRAMLVVARDALPALVESDDQVNLKVLVDRLQRHLTAHGRGPVDAELTTVYRAASAHLRVGARGYAERVGGARPPILLGDIAVERRYEVPAPQFFLRPWGPRSLLWVPAAGTDPSAAGLRRWTAPLGVSLAEARP
jgi:hypothetical protein